MLHVTFSRIGWLVIGILCVTTMVHLDKASAEPSLATKDLIDELVVDIDGEKRSFTVIADATQKRQWFYIPDEPRLVERENKNEKIPEFFLLKYSHLDPSDAQKIVEEGLLQFSIRLAIPPEGIEKMKAKLAQRVGIKQKQLLLSALPFKSAQVTLYDDGGKLVAKGTHGAGLAPTYSTQKMAFTVPLTRVGTSVMDALVKGQGGIHMAIEYEYEGWTPPLGFHCEANYEKAHSFYSKNKKFGAKASYLGVFSGATNIDKSKIRETLEKEEIVKCDQWGKSGDALDTQVQAILNRINTNIVQTLTPPADLSAAATAVKIADTGKGEEKGEEVDAEKAGKKKKKKSWLSAIFSGKFSGGVEYNMKLVDMKSVITGRQVIDLKKRNLETRKSIVSGIIGIGSYPEALHSQLVQELNVEHGWPAAYFSLPVIGEDIGVTDATLEVNLPGSKSRGQSARWTPKTGWRDALNAAKVINVLSFSLIGIEESEKRKLDFTIDMSIARGFNVVNVSMTTPVADANTTKFISSPIQAMKVLEIDGSNLSWRKINAAANLLTAEVSLLLSNGKKLLGTLKPRNISGKFTEPLPFIFLVHNEVTDVTPTISFVVNGKVDPAQWAHNGKKIDMEGVDGAKKITLQDVEVQ